MLNLLVLIIVMATVAYYASLVVEFILMALNFQRKLGSQKLSIIIIVAIYLAVLGPLVYDGINISFYNLGAVECEGSSQEDESDSSSKVPPCDRSNSLSSSLQKGASALQQALRNDYIAPITAITVAAGAVKVLSTVPKNSRAGVAVSLVTSLGGVSVAAQGLATLREANCTKKSPVLEEVKKLEKSPSWVADSPNEGMESLFSSAPGLESVVIGLMRISVGCLLLAWALFVGQLVNTLKISEWKIRGAAERPLGSRGAFGPPRPSR